LKDTCENCSHFGRSVVVWQLFMQINVSIFIKMEKIEYHAVIKFLRLRGNICLHKLKSSWTLFTRTILSFAIVKRWATEFKRDRISLADERSRQSTTVLKGREHHWEKCKRRLCWKIKLNLNEKIFVSMLGSKLFKRPS